MPNEWHFSHLSTFARARIGCIFAEATAVKKEGRITPFCLGLWNNEQLQAFKPIVSFIKKMGSIPAFQLAHAGRKAGTKEPWRGGLPLDEEDKKNGHDSWDTLAPSALPVAEGWKRPKAMEQKDINDLVEGYVKSAKLAIEAGFEVLEIHAAHGYLIDQFLNSGSNQRTDKYGGSIENRCRLLFEVLDAVSKAVGPGKCAVRLSPHAPGTKTYSDCTDPNPDALYEYAIKGINQFPLAYLLLTEPRWDSSRDDMVENDPGFNMPVVNGPKFRQHYQGTLILAGGFTPKSAQEAVESGMCDAIAFGRWFISNPDLPARLKNGIPLNRYNRKTFYAYSNVGYTDDPTAEEVGMGETKYTQIEQDKIGKSLASAKL